MTRKKVDISGSSVLDPGARAIFAGTRNTGRGNCCYFTHVPPIVLIRWLHVFIRGHSVGREDLSVTLHLQ